MPSSFDNLSWLLANLFTPVNQQLQQYARTVNRPLTAGLQGMQSTAANLFGVPTEAVTAALETAPLAPVGPAKLPAIRVPKFGYNISRAERKGLERGMQLLDEKIPGWRKLPGEGYQTRVVPRYLPETYGEISGPNPLDIYKMEISKNILSNPSEVASTMLHELMHIPVADLALRPSRFEFVPPLQRLANVASQRLPLAERIRIGAGYPQSEKTDYLEELVTSLMSHQSGRRLGLPEKTWLDLPPWRRDPRLPLSPEERLWR